MLLAQYSAQNDVVVGTPYANRNMPELQQLAGCLVNTLALRTVITGDPTFQQLLKGVSAASMEAFSHADAPFAKVVQALKQPRSASFTPVYQVSRGGWHWWYLAFGGVYSHLACINGSSRLSVLNTA